MVRVVSLLMGVILLVSIVQGCAGSVVSVAYMDANELTQVPNEALCQTYGNPMFGGGKEIRAELNRRNVISGREWSLIDQKQITIGMSLCAMLASWGAPNRFSGGAINRMVTENGERIQWVYRQDSDSPSATYVYTENGRVVAYQD